MTSPRVLVVEDNPIDVRMIKRALKLGGLQDEPQVVNDGATAIALLGRDISIKDVWLPDLVLLDLNLITVDGEKVLEYIRGTPSLKGISVAILSCHPGGLSNSGKSQADCWFAKPSDLEEFEDLGRKILACHEKIQQRRAPVKN